MPSLPLTAGGEASVADAGEHSIPNPARASVWPGYRSVKVAA